MAVRRRAALSRAKGLEPSEPAARARPRLYTAQDVARFCEVDLKTVHHWADRGKVACFRTDGRHLRFRRNDVVRFLRAHDYPLPDEVVLVRPRVLWAASPALDDLAKRVASRAAVDRRPNAVAAVAHLHADAPDALVFSLSDPTLGGAPAVAALRTEVPWLVLAAIADDDVGAALAAASGADVALVAADAARLPQELARALALA